MTRYCDFDGKIKIRHIEKHSDRLLGHIFINLELFEFVSCGTGSVATAIPEALSMITQSKISGDVAVDIKMEKR